MPDLLTSAGLWDGVEAPDALIEPVPFVDPDAWTYTKRTAVFDTAGDVVHEPLPMKGAEVDGFVARAFAESAAHAGLPPSADAPPGVLIALSGGRDSLAMSYLLAKCLPPGHRDSLRAVTVQAISPPQDVQTAVEACASLGIAHTVVPETDIVEQHGLAVPVVEALQAVLDTCGQHAAISVCHMLMRSAVERTARDQSITTVALGLHNEDLMASLVRSFMTGIPLGESVMRMRWGDFIFAYPLWGITKKELTLYLMATAPPHARQGAPSLYDRGNDSRDINYLMADSLQTLLPESSLHFFVGYERLITNMRGSAVAFVRCRNCGATIRLVPSFESPELCVACDHLRAVGCLESRPRHG